MALHDKHEKDMKKYYVKPAVCVQRVEIENLLAASPESGQITEGDAKGNDFWDDDDTPALTSADDSWE